MAGLAPRRALRAIAAVLLAAAAAACSDGASSPLEAPDAPAYEKAGSGNGGNGNGQGNGHLRTGKYRDSGHKPATGRSGSAVLSARALMWRDGVVRLLVTTGDVDDPGAAPGELAKVQLKIFSPEGRMIDVQNHQRPSSTGSHVFLLHGLLPGSTVRVQANVRGIDRNRTDVVVVTETVRLASSLAVALDPLPDVVPGVPTVVSATVSETGGTVGTYTSCTLYVDGIAVDRIDQVWVDAGDAVTCAFTHTFAREGTYDVSVVTGDPGQVGTLLPDPATGTVDVVSPPAVGAYRASVLDRTVAIRETYDLSWWKPDGSTRVYSHDNGESSRTQATTFTGTFSRAAAFPLATVEVRLSSNVAPWQETSWSGVGDVSVDAQGRSCVNRMVPEHGGHFHLCTAGGTTSYGYTRFGGTVIYHSRGFTRQWDAVAGVETYWSWNEEAETYASGGQHRPRGTALTIAVHIQDALGPMGGTVTVPIASFQEPETGTPRSCYEESPWWLEGGVQTICESNTRRVFGWSGEAAG